MTSLAKNHQIRLYGNLMLLVHTHNHVHNITISFVSVMMLLGKYTQMAYNARSFCVIDHSTTYVKH